MVVAPSACTGDHALTGAPADHSRAWRAALWIAALSTVARLIVAAFTPLFPDETYYWEWSRRLATGYFDHPPMVSWLTALGTAVAGHTPLGVRLGCVIAGGVAALALSATARRFAGDRAALLAAIVFAAMPLSAAGLVLTTPDAPLFAFAALAWYAMLRALDEGAGSRSSLLWWCVTGLALGFAITSKYTAGVLAIGVLLGMFAHPDLRTRFREPGPWVAVFLALIVYTPVIVWNTQHDWISLTFQLRHGFAGRAGSMMNRELELIGGQAALVSPVLFALCGIAVWRGLRDDRAESRLLGVAALFVFAFFIYSATKRRVEANWPALAYLPALLLLSAMPASIRLQRWLRVGVGLAALLSIAAYLNAFVPILPVAAARDPAARAYGWNDIARAVDSVRASTATRTHVAADRYQEASELAFHLPGRPETFALNLVGRANQYDLWPSFRDRARPGDDLILVLDELPDTPAQITQLAPHFAAISRGALLPLTRRGTLIKNLRVWQLRAWRGTWPRAELRSRS